MRTRTRTRMSADRRGGRGETSKKSKDGGGEPQIAQMTQMGMVRGLAARDHGGKHQHGGGDGRGGRGETSKKSKRQKVNTRGE